LVRIIVEANQLLCSVFWTQNIPAPYRLTHKNHCVSVWCRVSSANFQWALAHAKELCVEYTARYGKIHKSSLVVNWCEENLPRLKFDKSELTPFAQAMPEKYKNTDAVTAYRSYFLAEKKHLFNWKRNRPNWLTV
jgi:hypothetical protein